VSGSSVFAGATGIRQTQQALPANPDDGRVARRTNTGFLADPCRRGALRPQRRRLEVYADSFFDLTAAEESAGTP